MTSEPSSLRLCEAVDAVRWDGIQVTLARSTSFSNTGMIIPYKRACTREGASAQEGPLWMDLTTSRQSDTYTEDVIITVVAM